MTIKYLQPNRISVNKEKIKIIDKYDGYYFVNTEPENIPDIVIDGTVIKVNYEIRNDLSYTIKYVEQDTNVELRSSDVKLNQTYGAEVIEKSPTIDGYININPEETITITTGLNEIVFKYAKQTDLSYTVRYVDQETGNEIKSAVTYDGQVFDSEVTEIAPDVEGYTKVNPEETITITTGTNEIIFYYEKVDGLTYTVEYLEKDTNKEISLPKVVDEKVYGDEVTENAIDIDGYVKVEPTSETITIGMNENVIKFYYTKRTDLSYTVKYIDQETGEEIKHAVTYNNQVFDSEVTEEAPDVEGYTKVNPEETITITTGTNEIIFYYEKVDGLSYIVKYIEIETNIELETPKSVDGKVYGDEVTESAIDINGYIKIEPSSKTIIIGMKDNIITFYYTKRTDLKYTVEYYFNGVKDEALTETIEGQTFNSEVTTYTDKVKVGYKLDRVETIPLIITTGENKIKVYYVTDNTQTKNISYTVEYYKDGKLIDRVIEEDTVHVLEEEITVRKDKINITDMYEGYSFVNTPDTVTDGTIIKVNYEIKDDLSYTIKYVDPDTNKDIKPEEIKNGLTYGDKVTENAPDIDGYTKVNPEESITIGTDENVIIFYYTKRTDLTYKVEYSLTEIIKNQTFENQITSYTDKVKTGYKLDKVETIPLTITTGENVIKVFYVIDDTQTKELSYTVEYYKDGVLADTEIEKTTVQYLESNIITVNKNKVNITNKYEGYYFVNTSPDVIPDTVQSGDTIKVYYEVRADLSYTVKYIDTETGNELKDPITKTNQKLDSKVTEIAPEIDGYISVEPEKTITITTGQNEITFEYTRRTDLSYTVEYYFDNKIDSSLTEIVENQTFGDVISTYTDKVKVGYKLDKVKTIPLTITTGRNVIKVYYAIDLEQTKKISYTGE